MQILPHCYLSAAPSFPAIHHIQSFGGERGWHLLLLGERLLLQTEGGTLQLDAAFAPKPGQRYKISIARAGLGVAISVDGAVLVKGDVVPFTDIVRNLMVGAGRDRRVFLLLGRSAIRASQD